MNYVTMCEKAWPDLRPKEMNTDNYQRGFPVWDQAQLQKMILDKFDCPSHSAFANIINLGWKFSKMAKVTIEFDYWVKFTCMEELWLAFVMREKCDKIWNGYAWVRGPKYCFDAEREYAEVVNKG